MIQHYHVDNIDLLCWPEHEEGQYAKRFLLPLIKKGIKHFVDNIDTTLMALHIDDHVMPITINETQYHNSYVCSLYGQYVSCAQEAVGLVENRWIRIPLKGVVNALGAVLKLGRLNKTVIVNNWLFSTDLHQHLTEAQIIAIRHYLSKQFPSHAIVFRSINTFQNDHLQNGLKESGFRLIASRQVFMLDARKEEIFSSRIYKSDLKLLRESTYEELDNTHLTPAEAERIAELYQMIYINKHSQLNPKWNHHFIQLLIENQLLHLKALRKNGHIDAVVGYFCRNGTMTSPLLGYDATRSSHEKLYRLTSTVLTMEARKHKQLFHLSAGASFFKKIRKAQPIIEYHAVYHKHLPFYRKIPWILLKWVLNTIGVPFMRYYDK